MTKETKKIATNLLLHINGGLGKCIMATAVIASYKRTYPDSKVVVVSGYPEVFVNNPYVYKNFPFATPYLWKDYYGQPDWKVSAHDPYMEESWIKNNITTKMVHYRKTKTVGFHLLSQSAYGFLPKPIHLSAEDIIQPRVNLLRVVNGVLAIKVFPKEDDDCRLVSKAFI